MIKRIQKLLANRPTIRLMERLTGSRILLKMPLGLDLSTDIHYHLPDLKIRTIFDVGANVGQSENYFAQHFPDAGIYCFEPLRSTFDQLQANVRGTKTTCFNLGMGEVQETLEFNFDSGEHSETNSFLNNSANDKSEKQQVQVTTLKLFCDEHKIDHIDLLKIDTEGFDLKVLKGAESLLNAHAITLIEVEAGMNPTNTFHVNQSAFIDYLNEKGYYLFGMYDQIHDFVLKKPVLRRTNLVFISGKYIHVD